MIKQQLVRFLVVGLICTIINYISFFILLNFMNINFLIASALGYLLGVLLGYSMNRVWTFQHQIKSLLEKLKYLITYLLSLFIGLFFLKILVINHGFKTEIANIYVILITTILNFLGAKYWVFKE